MEIHFPFVKTVPHRKFVTLMSAAEVDISLSVERTPGWRWWNVGSFGYSFDIDGVVVGEIDRSLLKR